MSGKCLSGHPRSATMSTGRGHGAHDGKVVRLLRIFQLEWLSMWYSDWAEILCGNVSRLEKHPLKILHDLHVRFGRCFRTKGGSWARHARSWDIWRDVALSEGTPLRHEQDALVRF